MHEKFDELFEKSKLGNSMGFDVEKFAKLIVTECATLVDETADSSPFLTFGQLIKNHFGMEL